MDTLEKPDHISQADWDAVEVPEWTEADFATARPFSEVFPAQFESWKKNQGGRPKIDSPKKHVSLRLAADVVDGIRATGKGYNARIEKLLRDALASGQF